jgi:hypothetical protein
LKNLDKNQLYSKISVSSGCPLEQDWRFKKGNTRRLPSKTRLKQTLFFDLILKKNRKNEEISKLMILSGIHFKVIWQPGNGI